MDGSLFQPDSSFTVKWLDVNRNVVPEYLECYGVSLSLWQEWFDCVDNLWTKRISNFVNAQSRSKCLLMIFEFFTRLGFFSMGLSIVLALSPGNEYPCKRLLSIISYTSMLLSFEIAFILFLPLACFNICFIKPAFYATEDIIEKMWSDLVLKLNDGKCKELGLNVKPLRNTMHLYGSQNQGIQKTIFKTHNMTVGLEFDERDDIDLEHC
jgi:hypothetical protein